MVDKRRSSNLKDILQRSKYKSPMDLSKESMAWFKKNVGRLTALNASTLMRNNKDELVNSATNIAIGKMYTFFYYPKWRKELPYYDRTPLIIPIHKEGDRFLALNLHYIPPKARADLIIALDEVLNNKKYDQTTKYKITYGLLKSASKYKWYKPAIKEYLHSHVKSRFLRHPPETWHFSIFLPTENFDKASKTKVWADSRRMIGKFSK